MKKARRHFQQTTLRVIILKSRNCGTVVNIPRSVAPTERAIRLLIQNGTKEPRKTSLALQASLASVKMSIHDSTIRKSMGLTKITIPKRS